MSTITQVFDAHFDSKVNDWGFKEFGRINATYNDYITAEGTIDIVCKFTASGILDEEFPLHKAIELQDRRMTIQLLLTMSPDEVNKVDRTLPFGKTALYIAATAKQVKLCELLLNNKSVDPNIGNPLLACANLSLYDEFKALVSSGRADVNQKSVSGNNPLIYAVSFGMQNFVELLMENTNIDLDITYNNKSLLDLAVEFPAIVDLLTLGK